jgi:hypothetical protein
MKLRS